MKSVSSFIAASLGYSLVEALDSATIYEQVAAAPHEPGFWEENHLPGPPRCGGAVDRDTGLHPKGPAPGTHFASVFSSNAVLQREPAKAALYGRVLPSVNTMTKVTVTVSPAIQGETSFVVNVNADGSWKVLLPAAKAGGNYSASAACSDCANTSATILYNLTFGDIWFCSGQSNMQLSILHTFDRNYSKHMIANGYYRNIRFFNYPNIATKDGDEEYVPIENGGGPWYQTDAKKIDKRGNEVWAIDDFSAHCWYTFMELTNILDGDNVSTPFGLIESAWGGTQVQAWTPNATLDSSCTNLTGGKPQQSHVKPGSGALFNGMVLPFVNMSIKGATWFQGENNCQECNNSDAISDANACGNILEKTGYPCYLKTMIDSWRRVWSATPGTTDPEFPFGIQTLQSTEGSCGHGAIRWAQALNEAVLPSKNHPNIFLSQGFDAQDPVGIGNWLTGIRGNHYFGADSAYPMQASYQFQTLESGTWDGTQFFMGPIHPRPKRIVGRRMALAAATTAYGRKDIVSVGPTIKNCSVVGNSIHLYFDEGRFGDDAIHVFPGLLGQNYDLPLDVADSLCSKLNGSTKHPLCSSFGGVSPLEVRYSIPINDMRNETVWIPTSIRTTSARKLNTNCPAPCQSPGIPKGCCTNFTRVDEWNMISTHSKVDKHWVPPIPGTHLGDYITGVRYAWSANPCCPTINRDNLPCPVNSCPIRGWNSTLPANPFYAEIVNGQCQCIKPQDCGGNRDGPSQLLL